MWMFTSSLALQLNNRHIRVKRQHTLLTLMEICLDIMGKFCYYIISYQYLNKPDVIILVYYLIDYLKSLILYNFI